MSRPSEAKRPTNSVERAYEALRAMAVRFELKPGERLNEVEIAKRLAMSRAPLREAMNRLATEGLLTFVPNQGFSCRKLSASEIASLYEVRADLEAAGARAAALRARRGELEELDAYWSKVAASQATTPIETLVARDEEFHLRLAALSGNRERVRMLENINARIHFVRRINLENPARLRESFAEHAGVLVRLLQGDGEGAAELLRSHLALSAEEAAVVIREGLARIYAESVA
ncbi:MAG TPA: GntR family transcriptional regulator [Dongiaceae bacterium]|nr:GntR family transcriptional regulator [Dongiaceae bacterium]